MASGPAAGLAIVDELARQDAMHRSHLLPAVRAEMLVRLNRTEEARIDYLRAAQLCDNTAERDVLLRKAGVSECPAATPGAAGAER
jgi:predicted RNA polymerase sigma factor